MSFTRSPEEVSKRQRRFKKKIPFCKDRKTDRRSTGGLFVNDQDTDRDEDQSYDGLQVNDGRLAKEDR